MKLHNIFFFRIMVILILIMVVGSITKLTDNVWSHGPHTGKGYKEQEKKGPNDGKMIELGENYIEFVVDYKSGEIALIMLDKEMESVPFPENITALGYLRMADGPLKWVDFQRGYLNQIPYLAAETGIENIGPFNAVVSLNIVSLNVGEERKNLHFSWAPAAHEHGE